MYKKRIFIYGVIFLAILIVINSYQNNLLNFIKKTPLHSAKPDWLDLTKDQQIILLNLKEDWGDLTPDSRIIFLVLTDRILKLDKKNIAIFQQRIQNWSKLSPQERRLARANYLSSLEISQNNKITAWNAYQELSPDEKKLLERNSFQRKSLVNSPSMPIKIQ